MRGDVAPIEPPVDDGGGDANGHTGEGHCLAPGSLDHLLGWGHDLGGHWRDQSRGEGCEGQRKEEWGMAQGRGGKEGQRQERGPQFSPSSLLTAAKLITAVRTVALLITVEAGWDAGVCGDAAELCGPTHVLGALGS